MMHELVLGGHLYLQLLKEKMEIWLLTLKSAILKKAKMATTNFDMTPQTIGACLLQTLSIERMFENFLGKFFLCIVS